MRLFALVFLFFIFSCTHSNSHILVPGRSASNDFLDAKLKRLHSQFDVHLSSVISLSVLEEFSETINHHFGKETKLIQEQSLDHLFGQFYYRDSKFEHVDSTVETMFVFNSEGKIIGFSIKTKPQEAPTSYRNYRTKTRLALPFTGDWYVLWGGRSIRENHHAALVEQRFALDLLVVKMGKSHRGEGTHLSDYYCFGKAILSPGTGTVVSVVQNLPDQIIGNMDVAHPEGNHVVIDHGNGEYSLLAHLQSGSVAVSVGDALMMGQPVGKCGNSGNSSQPHLHYQLQTHPSIWKGESLPAQFANYLADGKRVSRAEPSIGQIISKR